MHSGSVFATARTSGERRDAQNISVATDEWKGESAEKQTCRRRRRRRRHSAHSGHSRSAFEGAFRVAELVIRFHSEAADRIANALTNI